MRHGRLGLSPISPIFLLILYPALSLCKDNISEGTLHLNGLLSASSSDIP